MFAASRDARQHPAEEFEIPMLLLLKSG